MQLGAGHAVGCSGERKNLGDQDFPPTRVRAWLPSPSGPRLRTHPGRRRVGGASNPGPAPGERESHAAPVRWRGSLQTNQSLPSWRRAALLHPAHLALRRTWWKSEPEVPAPMPSLRPELSFRATGSGQAPASLSQRQHPLPHSATWLGAPPPNSALVERKVWVNLDVWLSHISPQGALVQSPLP